MLNMKMPLPSSSHSDSADTKQAGPPAARGIWPPGPPSGLTGWGLLWQMSRDLPGTLADWRRRYGDIFHLRIWPEHQVVVADPTLVRELLVTHHASLVRWERGIDVMSQFHGHSVLTAEAEAWRLQRQALQPAFAPKQVHDFIPAIVGSAELAFAGWRTDGPDWGVEDGFTRLSMDVIVRTMFSSEIDEDSRLAQKAVHDLSVAANAEFYWPVSWPDWMPWKRSKRDAIRVLNKMIERHIQARLKLTRGCWPADLLTRLLELHLNDPNVWSLPSVRDECMTAFLAGHETSAATLTWWSWCMASNLTAQEATRREVDAVLKGRLPNANDLPRLPTVIASLQETMRLYPAAPMLLTRRAVCPIVLNGWEFPARTLFSVPLQLIQEDARWFPDPQRFRLERFANDAYAIPRGAFLPFGTGPRVCLGQHLAMAEMTIIAAMFLQRFTVSPSPGMAAPQPILNITLRPALALRLKLENRI